MKKRENLDVYFVEVKKQKGRENISGPNSS